MRTPNTKCCICEKPLYRRPADLKKYQGVCCIGCRSDYYKRKDPSPNLKLGREKGTNHLKGISKSKESNIKRSISHKKWCAENIDKVKKRGLKIRGKNHYNWNGGISDINKAIRLLDEYRKWQKIIKKTYNNKCSVCNSKKNIESHHVLPLSMLIEQNKITNIDEARACIQLWLVSNGIALCRKCHYKIHKRKYNDND